MKKIYFLMTMSLLLAVNVWSQAVKLTGQVKNVQGEPVPFATITVKGTSEAVSADQSGSFTISARTRFNAGNYRSELPDTGSYRR